MSSKGGSQERHSLHGQKQFIGRSRIMSRQQAKDLRAKWDKRLDEQKTDGKQGRI